MVHPVLLGEEFLNEWEIEILSYPDFTMICSNCNADLNAHDLEKKLRCPEQLDTDGCPEGLCDTKFRENKTATMAYRVWLRLNGLKVAEK